MYKAVRPCPLCKGLSLDPLITRPKSSVLQNRTFASKAQASAALSGRLTIMSCRECGFIHNNDYDPGIISYTGEYENDQGNSPRFRRHMEELAGYVRGGVLGGAPLSIVEIGCGQGGFLNLLLHELQELRAQGFGFDTAYRGPVLAESGARYFREYFGQQTAPLIPGGEVILLTRHVIEHVPEPVQFLAAIRAAIPSSWRARLFIETPCVEWIFRNQAVQDFFYEHCNYWTAASLTAAARRAGFAVINIRHVFDGQYLWMEAVPAHGDLRIEDESPARGATEMLKQTYLSRENTTIMAWRACAATAALDGAVALWGAGAKGVTMAALIDPECELIDCLIDINAQKQNRYIPVTAHQVVSPDTAHLRGVKTALVMNSNYTPEISAMLAAGNITMRLIDDPAAHD